MNSRRNCDIVSVNEGKVRKLPVVDLVGRRSGGVGLLNHGRRLVVVVDELENALGVVLPRPSHIDFIR